MKNLKITIFTLLLGTAWVNAQNQTFDAFSKSYTLEAEGKYKESLASLENVPDGYAVQLRRAWLNYSQKAYLQAKAQYLLAIAKEPKSIEARLGLINALSALEQYEDAAKVYREILAIDANHSTSNYWLAYHYFLKKEFDKAEPLLQRLIALYPFDFDGNVLLAQVYLNRGKINEAKRLYNLALMYNPSRSDLKEVLEKL